jgi:hypothetical protein
MNLPSTGSTPRMVEDLEIGGGYNDAADGGMAVDRNGNMATNGDVSVDGSVSVGGFLNIGTTADLEIASGVITVTQTNHAIDVEGGSGGGLVTDDVDTINGGSDGDLIILRAKNGGRTIVFTELGNLALGASTRSLTHRDDRMMLIYDAEVSVWAEMFFADNEV